MQFMYGPDVRIVTGSGHQRVNAGIWFVGLVRTHPRLGSLPRYSHHIDFIRTDQIPVAPEDTGTSSEDGTPGQPTPRSTTFTFFVFLLLAQIRHYGAS